MDDESFNEEDTVEFHDYYKFRVSYITKKSLGLVFLFVTGLTDKFENIKKELVKCRREFVDLFEEILQHRFDAKTFEVFDPIVDVNHKNLRPKISLVGFSGVGKTTITRLIRAEEIPIQHIPTITGDIATVRIGKLHFHLWDFAGQEQFSYLWSNFIKGSDAVLLITDSTLVNVEKSKFFLELIKDQAPHAHIAVIGNKQDLGGAENPANIERILGLKSYSMIAKKPENRDKMIQIIADILEMSAEISPLLKPLLERDQLIEEATKSLKSANFEKAAFLFDKISYLCLDLGDDSLGKEFYEKSQKIKIMLEQVGAPQPTPAHPIESDNSEKYIESQKEEISENVSKPKPSIQNETLEVALPPAPKLPPSTSTQKKDIEDKVPVSPNIKQDTSRQWIKSSKRLQDKIIEKNLKADVVKVGLKLNPEDYMVKIRPKTIGVVPKGAKSKLKTSSYGHVKNEPNQIGKMELDQPKKPDESKVSDKSLKVRSPSRPSELFEKNSQSTPPQPPIASKIKESIEKHESIESEKIPKESKDLEGLSKELIESEETPLVIDKKQAEHAKKTLIDLKLKKADLYKMKLDFDMKELMGEISAEELEEKKKKIIEYEEKIEIQIQELQKLLEK